MGTSKSFGGPTGSNTLLPPWAPPLDPEPEVPSDDDEGQVVGSDDGDDHEPGQPSELERPPAWQGVLGQATRLARSGVTGGAARTRVRSTISNYVRNRGGARRAAEGSVAARRTAPRIGGFLSDIAKSGVSEALRNVNLDEYIGRSAVDLLVGISETLLPKPDTLDDSAAYDAGLAAFQDLLEQYDAMEEGIEALDALDAQGIERALEHFIARYISSAVLSVLSERIERGSATPEHCAEIHKIVRVVMIETVRLDFRGRDVVNMDWDGAEGRRVIDRLLLDAFSLLEEE